VASLHLGLPVRAVEVYSQSGGARSSLAAQLREIGITDEHVDALHAQALELGVTVGVEEVEGDWVGLLSHDPIETTAANFDDRVVATLAGPVAERAHVVGRHAQRPHYFSLIACGGESDLETVRCWSEVLDVRRYWTRCVTRTTTLVRDYWGDVEAWASLLEVHGRIDEPTGAMLVRGCP
jgi:hypothetical protein